MCIKEKAYHHLPNSLKLTKLLIGCGLFLYISLGCVATPPLFLNNTATPLPPLQIIERIRLGEGLITDMAVSPDGTKLAVATSLDVRLYDLGTLQLLHSLTGHTGVVESVTWSPDSTRLASASQDKTIRVWDSKEGQQRLVLQGHTDAVDEVIWSPNGAWLASSGANNDSTVRVWDAVTGQQLYSLEKQVGTISWSPDSTRLASASNYNNNIIQIWEAMSGRHLFTLLPDQSGSAEKLIWSPDSTQLVSTEASRSSENHNLLVWNTDSGELLHTLRGHSDKITDMAWSPNGMWLASTGLDATVRVWDAVKGRQINMIEPLRGQILEPLTEAVESVSWSPDGTEVVFGSWDGKVRVWALSAASGGAAGQGDIRELPGHHYNSRMMRVIWSSDGRYVVSVSKDNSAIHVWEAASGRQVGVLQGSFRVNDVAWSPDGTRLAVSTGRGGEIEIWLLTSDLTSPGGKSLELVHKLKHRAAEVKIAWSPDGTKLASGGYEKETRVQVWDTTTGNELNRFEISDTIRIYSLAWSPHDYRLVAGLTDGIQELNLTNGQQTNLLGDKAGSPQEMSWAPDGTLLALNNGAAQVWDTVSGRKLPGFFGTYPQWVGGVAWSPNGRLLASTGVGDNFQDKVEIWDIVSNQQVHELPGGSRDVTWSPDGTMLASSGPDIRMWDVTSGQQLGVAKGHTDEVVSIDWSPDGTFLASASQDGTVRIWEIRRP